MSNNEKPDDGLEELTTPREGVGLARLVDEKPEDKVQREITPIAVTNATDLREQLSLWIAQRLSLCSRETKLLGLLRQQVEDASQQPNADRVQRYLAQAVHLRSQILELRNEPNDLTIQGPT